MLKSAAKVRLFPGTAKLFEDYFHLWRLTVINRIITNALQGDFKRRVRGLPSPHAEIANAAGGVLIAAQGVENFNVPSRSTQHVENVNSAR